MTGLSAQPESRPAVRLPRSGPPLRAAGLPVLALAGLLAAAVSTAPPEAAPPGAPSGVGIPTLVLGPDGIVYSWSPGDPRLSPVPPDFASIGGRPVNDLAVSEGRVVLLPRSSPPPASRWRRLEGRAILASRPSGRNPARVLNEFAFEGDGRRVVISDDGRWAFVLSIRAGTETGPGRVRAWIHALDLEAGRVAATTALDLPPADIALDPQAARLYLSFDDRIATYTARPLASSWRLRSPGSNRGLAFRPGSAVLYAARGRQVACFDPAVISSREAEERQRLEDDATAVVPFPFDADRLMFSRDGVVAAAYGPEGDLAFVDPEARSLLQAPGDGGPTLPLAGALPFAFGTPPEGLLVAGFPDLRVRSIHPPRMLQRETPSPAVAGPEVVPEPAAVPSPTPEATPTPAGTGASPTPAAGPSPAAATGPPSLPQPAPAPPRAPEPTPLDERGRSEPVLGGRLSGRIELVKAVVVYGPGSIVREQARAAPEAGGTWSVPLPPPGTYRIVPMGEAGRPVRSDPNFHTVEVRDQGRKDLDFTVLGTP